MALLPHRDEAGNGASTNIDYFMNGTGEAGSVVKFVTSTSGTGAAMDDPNACVALPTVANGSGEAPAGILLCDVVNKDLSQTHLNYYKREVNIGGKVSILRRGVVTTNRIEPGVLPTPGQAAYFTTNGLLNVTSTNSTRVGTFLSGRNADGYAKLSVNLL